MVDWHSCEANFEILQPPFTKISLKIKLKSPRGQLVKHYVPPLGLIGNYCFVSVVVYIFIRTCKKYELAINEIKTKIHRPRKKLYNFVTGMGMTCLNGNKGHNAYRSETLATFSLEYDMTNTIF